MFELPSDAIATVAALRFSDADSRQLSALTSTEWSNLLTRHEFVRLTIPLRQTQSEHMPLWVQSRVDRHIADNVSRLERIKADYREIARICCEVGAEHLVIKGFAQWPGFTDHPCFHLQSDIDLYCPRESIDLARNAVLRLGYESSKDTRERATDHIPALIRRTAWHWNGNYFDPEMPVSIELHHCFWNTRAFRFGVEVEREFWERRVDRCLDGLIFPALSLQDNLTHSALQLLRDCLQDATSPAKLYQLARFLHLTRNDDAFWGLWSELESDQLSQMAAISFRAAKDVFACEMNEAADKEVRLLPGAINKWFECFGRAIFDRRLHRPQAGIWLHLALVEAAADRRALAIKHFLPYRPISLEAFADRDTVKSVRPAAGSIRRKRAQHLRMHAFGRARAFCPTLVQGLRYWWNTKNMGRSYWTFYGASLLFDLGMYIFFLLYNVYLLDRSFTARFLGLIVSAGALGSVFGTLFGGVLSNRLGLRRSLMICLPVVAVISMLRAVIGLPAVLMGLAFAGAAFAAVWAIGLCPAVAQMTTEDNRAFGFSVILSSGIAVGILGGFTGGHLPDWVREGVAASQLHAEQIALLIGCALVALAAWPISRINFGAVTVRSKTVYPRNGFLWRFLPAIAVWSLVTGGFSPFFNAYFSQQFHMPVSRIGTMLSLSQLSQVCAVLIAPLLFRRIGLIKGVMSTQIAAGIALACLAAAPAGFWAAALFTVFSAFEWMNEPGIFTLLMSRVSPEERTGASALMFLVISLSQAAAGALAGAGFARFGYPPVMFVIAIIACIAAALFSRLIHEAQNPAASAVEELEEARPAAD
ncbi:MAG TPA: MFS transporter [Candidatus Acidoferrales bacterium]|nr:MFS transporter [Candidatus Acidoferrales bacterium]